MVNVSILGRSGFLGKHLLNAFGDRVEFNADTVINAAAKVGGIEANSLRPGEFFAENLSWGMEFLERGRMGNAKKLVQIGTVCSYPLNCSIPMKECDFWNGKPEESNGAYGLAKRAIVDMAQAYSKQYGMNIINPILANLYGPGDHYEDERSHVIPAMIKKFLKAVENGDKTITFWGSGNCTREFLYVKDAAEAIKFLTDNYDKPEIINVSSGYEITINNLAEIIGGVCKFRGDILWDASKPDGQPRRHFDTSKLSKLGWTAKTSLAAGLVETISEFKESNYTETGLKQPA